MQGFTTKYYLRKAERGDFIVNRQAPTLQKKRHDRYLCDTIHISSPKADVRIQGREDLV